MQKTGLTIAQEDALYEWVESVFSGLNIDISWEYPDTMHSNKPYCIISVPVKAQPEHKPSRKYTLLDTYDYTFHNAFTFSVKIYDTDGSDYIRKMIKSQYKSNVIETLKSKGLTCRYDINNYFLPALASTVFEYREGVDFMMAYSEIDTEVIGEIQEVEIEGTVTGTFNDEEKVKEITVQFD